MTISQTGRQIDTQQTTTTTTKCMFAYLLTCGDSMRTGQDCGEWVWDNNKGGGEQQVVRSNNKQTNDLAAINKQASSTIAKKPARDEKAKSCLHA